MRILLCMCLLLGFVQATTAQGIAGSKKSDDDDDPYDTRTYFMYGLNYLSNNVYLGRKDTAVVPYVSPYIGYHLKSGLYAKAMASFTSAPVKHIDLYTLEAGYDHSFGDHFNGGANLDKYYHSKNTVSIRASTNGSAGIYGQYSNDWLEPQINFNADFNKKTDYVLGLDLDHNFKMISNTLNIIPTITMNSGTRYFLDEYFINRLKKKDAKLKLQKAIPGAGKFSILDYEFSTKVTYRTGKWLFTLTPTYAIPVSPAVITLPNKTVTEQLSNSFYVELDICHR